MKKIAFLFTLLVLFLLYWRIDRQAFVQHLQGMRLSIFVMALGCVIPQTLVTAMRWRSMVWGLCPMPMLETVRLILAGKALNALLPSKLGETSKAYFLKTHANVALADGVALVLLEKVFDVAGLCAMMLVGMLLITHFGQVELVASAIALGILLMVAGLCAVRATRLQRWGHSLPLRGKSRLARLWQSVLHRGEALLQSWDMALTQWRAHPRRFAAILLFSWLLWAFHLLQIWLFFVALHSKATTSAIIAYVPLGIFIGLLPLTIGGMGTRDAALITLFAPYESASVMAAIGLLCSLRYWLDSLLGLPFFHAYSTGKGA